MTEEKKAEWKKTMDFSGMKDLVKAMRVTTDIMDKYYRERMTELVRLQKEMEHRENK